MFSFSFSLVLALLFVGVLSMIILLFKTLSLSDVSWRIFYLILSFIIILFVFFYFAQDMLYLLIGGMKDVLVLRNLQEFTFLLIDVSFFFSFIYFCLLSPVTMFLYFVNILAKNKVILLYLLISYFYFFFLISFLILHFDLYTSSWDIFSYWKETFFDFQPNLEYIFYTYKGEAIDIFFWSFIIYLNFIFFIFNIIPLNKINTYRLFGMVVVPLVNLYFFGGDALITDLFVICISLFSLELWIFTYFLLMVFKRYRSY